MLYASGRTRQSLFDPAANNRLTIGRYASEVQPYIYSKIVPKTVSKAHGSPIKDDTKKEKENE
jgi:hypothetical protein